MCVEIKDHSLLLRCTICFGLPLYAYTACIYVNDYVHVNKFTCDADAGMECNRHFSLLLLEVFQIKNNRLRFQQIGSVYEIPEWRIWFVKTSLSRLKKSNRKRGDSISIRIFTIVFLRLQWCDHSVWMNIQCWMKIWFLYTTLETVLNIPHVRQFIIVYLINHQGKRH